MSREDELYDGAGIDIPAPPVMPSAGEGRRLEGFVYRIISCCRGLKVSQQVCSEASASTLPSAQFTSISSATQYISCQKLQLETLHFIFTAMISPPALSYYGLTRKVL